MNERGIIAAGWGPLFHFRGQKSAGRRGRCDRCDRCRLNRRLNDEEDKRRGRELNAPSCAVAWDMGQLHGTHGRSKADLGLRLRRETHQDFIRVVESWPTANRRMRLRGLYPSRLLKEVKACCAESDHLRELELGGFSNRFVLRVEN